MNIFVCNLPFSVNEGDLRELFSHYCRVQHAKIIVDYETGRSRGFGFVEIDCEACAKRAIQQLNQSDFFGRRIQVKEATPRPDKSNIALGQREVTPTVGSSLRYSSELDQEQREFGAQQLSYEASEP